MSKKSILKKVIFLLIPTILISTAISCKEGKESTMKVINEENIQIEKDIVFFKSDNYILHLDVYKPRVKKEKKLKPILWIHGGEFKPHVDKEQDYIVKFCKYFAEKGYLCIAPDYRTSEDPFANWEQTVSNTVDDTFKAIEWVKKNKNKYSLDLSHLIMAGGSAGGMISIYATAKYSSTQKTPPIFANIDLWGSPFGQVNYLTQSFPPTLIVHGTDDQSVPYKNSLNFSEKLNELGVYNELMTIEGGGHTPVSHFDEIALRIEAFLKKLEQQK